MSLSFPKPNHNDTSNYLVGAIPYATASLNVPGSASEPIRIQFPRVTQYFTVQCTGANTVRVGFSNNGVKNTNYFTVTPSGSYTGQFRLSEIFLLSNVSGASSVNIVAGLTPVPFEQLSNVWSGSDGVG
jgi:hypothetical protein